MMWQDAAPTNRSSPALHQPFHGRHTKSLVVIAHDGGVGTNARTVEGKDHGHVDRRDGVRGHAARRARFDEKGGVFDLLEAAQAAAGTVLLNRWLNGIHFGC